MQSRKRKIAINIFSASSVSLLNIILAFVSRVIFLRVLNESYLGISSLFTNIIGVLSLADLGIGTAMIYSMYQPIAENDTDKLASLVAYFKKIYLAIAAVVFIFGISLIPFLQYIIHLEEDIPYISVYYVLSLLGTVATYLFIYRNALISADQKGYVINNITIVSRLIIFIVNVIVLVCTKNYILYLSVSFILSLFTNFIINLKAKQMYPYLKQKAQPLGEKDKQVIKENVKALFIGKLSGTIVCNTDNILTSILVSTVMVGFYSNYIMVVAHITNFIALVFSQMRASVGNKLAIDKENAAEKVELFYVLEFINFWLVGFSSIAFFVLLNDFIALSFGTKYLLSSAIVAIVCANFYVGNMGRAVDTFRQTAGLFQQTYVIVMINALLNLAFSILLGSYMGLFGILLATVIAHFLSTFWKMPFVVFHEFFHASSKKYFVNYSLKTLLTMFAGWVTYVVAQILAFENDYFCFVFKMLVCTIVPNVIFLVFTFKSKEFTYLRRVLWNPLLKKIGKCFSKQNVS